MPITPTVQGHPRSVFDLDDSHTVVTSPPDPGPSFGATLGAAFRQDNSVGSLLNSMTGAFDPQPTTPNYSAWDEIKGTPYQDHWQAFAGSTSPGMTMRLKAQIDQETKDRSTLAAAGWGGTIASLAAGITDPVLLLPIGGEVAKTGEGVYRIGRAALAGAEAGGVSVGAQEAALQSSQQTRTIEDSAMNIGGGVVLGGLLGGAAHALLSPAEKANGLKAYDTLLDAASPAESVPGSIGAAAKAQVPLADLSVSGNVANAVGKATQFVSPNMRLNYSPSAVARQVGQDLAEGTMYQGMHEAGETLGPAVETLARTNFRAREADAVQAHEDIYKEMKQSGINMSRSDFEEQVGNAMRNEDVGDNDFISRAAASWRQRIVDPYFNEAKAAGIMEDGDKTATAPSYFPRQYNSKVLTANEAKIKDEWSSFMEGRIQSSYADSAESLRAQRAGAEQELADLRLSPEDRATTLADLEQKGDALDAANPQHVEHVSTINDLRRQAKAAKDSGDTAGAKAAADSIAEVQARGGQGLKDYLQQRGQLRSRYDRVDLNYAGIEARQQRVLNSIERNRDAAERGVQRLVGKGKALQRVTDRLDPAKVSAKLSDLKSSFADVLDKSQKAQDRASTALERMKSDARGRIDAALQKEGLDRWLLDNANTVDPAFASLNLKAAEKSAKRAHGRELTDIEKTRAEAVARVETERDATIRDRLEREHTAEAARHERLTSLSKRIEDAEKLDPHTALAEARSAVDEATGEVADVALRRGEKAARLKERLAALDPKRLDERVAKIEARVRERERAFADRWEIKHLGEGIDPHDPSVVPSFKAISKDIVDETFDKLTGRNYGDGSSVDPEYLTPITRGPMKERTLPIPDEMLHRQGVLHSNAREVLTRYARVMGADTELTARFGSPKMDEQFGKLRDEYRQLREQAKDSPKALRDLTKREAQDANDLMALRDLIRGTYKAKENASTFARVVRAAQHMNYVRSMGGVIPASLSDLYRPAMVHGLSTFMGQGVAPLLKNIEAVKLSVAEAKLAGQCTEAVLQHRLVSLGEMADPMARGTPVERFLENGSKVASKLNGIQYWTDAMKSVTAIMSQNRLLDGSADKRTLAFLGIDGDMADRIGKQFKKNGEVRDGVHIAATEKWDDPLAVKHFRAAVAKDVDSIIVTPGVGDVPLFSHTPLGKLVLQFRSFMFASHQRVLMRGLQESKAGFVASMIGMSTFGVMAAVMKAWRGGEDRWNKFKEAAQNPGYVIGEGLDNSGMFTLPFDFANTTEKLSTSAGFMFNPIKTPLMGAGALARPGASREGQSVRFASRGPLGTLLGPTAGMLEQGFTASQAVPQGVSKSSKNAAIGLIPFNSYLGMREAVQALNGDSPYTDNATER